MARPRETLEYRKINCLEWRTSPSAPFETVGVFSRLANLAGREDPVPDRPSPSEPAWGTKAPGAPLRAAANSQYRCPRLDAAGEAIRPRENAAPGRSRRTSSHQRVPGRLRYVA